MTPTPRPPGANHDLIGAFPSCALDQLGRERQRARYARLARTVAHVERAPDSIVIRFNERLDRDLLERTLTIERSCCPFLAFRFAEPERRLEIGVGAPEHVALLEALGDSFAAVPRPGPEAGH